MDDDGLRRALVDHAYLEGDFVLRSGRKSRYYLDKYRFETQPSVLRPLAERLAEAVRRLEPEAVRLACPVLGAVVLASATSIMAELPFVIVRDEAKEHGTANQIEGAFEAGELVCLIEDIVTSGGALVEAVEAPDSRVRGRPRGGRRRRARARRRAPHAAVSHVRAPRIAKKCRKTAWLSRKQEPVTLRRGSNGSFSRRVFVPNVSKQDFIDRVASKSDLNKREASKAVDAFIETVTESLRRGDSITFTGFGKFSTSDRAARTGVNPRTGEKVDIAAARVPKFSAGSALKQAVKSGGGMGGGMGGGY